MRHELRPAVAFMMLSVALYATQDVLVKSLPAQYSVFQISFFRGLFALIPVGFMYFAESHKQVLKTERWGLHIIRALCSTASLFLFIGAFRLIPLADAYVLTFSCPLFMTLLSPLLLKESVSIHRWVAVLLGFLGVIVMMRPGGENLGLGGIIALLGGLAYAFSLVLVRNLSRTENNTMIVFTFTLMSIAISGAALPFVWEPMDLDVWKDMIVIGILGGSAQYAMTHAFRLSEVSAIAPFDYAALLWGVAYGYFFFGDVPDVYMYVGATLIISSGFYLIRQEKPKLTKVSKAA